MRGWPPEEHQSAGERVHHGLKLSASNQRVDTFPFISCAECTLRSCKTIDKFDMFWFWGNQWCQLTVVYQLNNNHKTTFAQPQNASITSNWCKRTIRLAPLDACCPDNACKHCPLSLWKYADSVAVAANFYCRILLHCMHFATALLLIVRVHCWGVFSSHIFNNLLYKIFLVNKFSPIFNSDLIELIKFYKYINILLYLCGF